MSKSYRIRTQVGVDKSLKVMLEQDFEFLEILSLKILQSQIYTRPCSDYGVIVGRVTVNDGFGVPNVKVSVFIPLDGVDEANPIITEIYPYKNLTDGNEDGYRYNLLPYEQQHSGHVPTGTFFDREDVLTNPTIIEVYDKYFKYTARTNDSGDYMIFGVPVGAQTIHIDCDLSDIGEFSLSPQDLIRMGVASESQVAGTKFKASSNLGSLPQIISINKTIEVEPLWGQPEICNLGITRTDFDLTSEANIDITPTAIFMGSIISDENPKALKRSCRPKYTQGELCSMITGPGEILAIRQTIIPDVNGRPVLETVQLQAGGQIIDDNGTWLLDVPMNLDYVVTNEFGEQVLSNDPKKGIPTKAKYRFKIKWNQSPSLSENIKRGYFLVPNIREYGWDSTGTNVINPTDFLKSYSFSLDWNDYPDIQAAIDCKDYFYPMKYNKVYTVSQLIDQYRKGYVPPRIVSVKNILDDVCESDNVKFPTNDSSYRVDILYLLFYFLMYVFRPVLYTIIILVHIVALILLLLVYLTFALATYYTVISLYFLTLSIITLATSAWPPNATGLAQFGEFLLLFIEYGLVAAALWYVWSYLEDKELKDIKVPLLLYDSCEFCTCEDGTPLDSSDTLNSTSGNASGAPNPPQNPLPNSPTQLNIPDLSGSYNSNSNNPLNIPLNGLMAGQPFGSSIQNLPFTCATRTPTIQPFTDSSGDYYYFSSSLTLPERINLFNTKAKYFDETITSPSIVNPGGGVNKIKVFVEPSLNPPSNFHTDNVVVMLMKDNALSQMTPGMLLSFQDIQQSTDPNLKNQPGTNQFGNYATTGTSNITNSVTINYTKTDLTAGSTTYTLPTNVSGYSYVTFPADMEYFQVITAMTYQNFNSQCTSNTKSLNTRFFNNDMYYNKYKNSIIDNNCVTNGNTNPITSYNNFNNLTVVIMVRGVDPYSPRYQVKYDLSVLFGDTTFTGSKTVTGDYKLNVPIQGGFKNVSHNLANHTSNDPYSSMDLYYDSFTFTPDSPTYLSFVSTLPHYYSRLDNNNNTFNPGCGCLLTLNTQSSTSSEGLRVSSSNEFTLEWNVLTPSLSPLCDGYYLTTTNDYLLTPLQNRGYYLGEIVEGATMMGMDATMYPPGAVPTGVTNNAYFSPTFATSTPSLPSISYNYSTKIVMRSDRLPGSTTETLTCDNSLIFQQNYSLNSTGEAIYGLDDNGYINSTIVTSPPPVSIGPPDPPNGSNFTNAIIDSLNNCSKSANLECYGVDSNGEFTISYGSCQTYLGKQIFKNGCYIFVTTIILSLLKDFALLAEWISRVVINFGACRNIWSHLFTNNWINGTLYAFAFKNDRFFNSQNQPYSDYCRDVVYLHPVTLNFYYRSSPFDGTNFVGSPVPSGIFGGYGGNEKNLKYPTTILDLGPRTDFLQELVMSDEFDGYVANKLSDTTFGDVSDLFNIFILSRLVNTSVISQITGVGGGADVFLYFDRPAKTVDADYAQMISINSEIGVAEFDSANYPSVTPGVDPIWFNGGNASDAIIGIFFSSDTQVRDYITPKRTIISPTANATSTCAFNNIPVFSQVVPFHQWEVKTGNPDSIFGSQNNDWYTNNNVNPGGGFFAHEYQSLDRLLQSSRYFRGQGSTSLDFKGYIFSINGAGYDPTAGSQQLNSTLGRVISVGAPFHFYFGLKKGKTSFDRFARKWINFETIVD